MCWHGDDDADLRITSATQMDPGTEARQKFLWDEAQRFAGQDPFSAEYGGAAAYPGLSPMAQRGQQYLTNQILGPSAYGAGWTDPTAPVDPTTGLGITQNLGFTGYQRPADAASPTSGYDPKLQSEAAWIKETSLTGKKAKPRGPITIPEIVKTIPELEATAAAEAAAAEAVQQQQQQYQQQWQQQQQQYQAGGAAGDFTSAYAGYDPASAYAGGPTGAYVGGPTGAYAGEVPQQQRGLLGSRTAEGAMRAAQPAGPTMIGASDPGWDAFLATKSPAVQAQLRAQAEQFPNMAVALTSEQQRPAQAARPYSPTVGVREMEEAGDVTRRMLMQQGPAAVGYDRFLPGEIDTATGLPTPGTAGWLEGTAAGIGETPGFTRDATGNLVPIEDFGFSGAELERPTYDEAGEMLTPGYRPGYDAIRGQVTGVGTDAVRATPFDVAERDPFTVGETMVGPYDPGWEAFLATKPPANRAALRREAEQNPDWKWPLAGDVQDVQRGLISAEEGYGTEGLPQRPVLNEDGTPVLDAAGEPVMESALPMTEAQRELSQIGQVVGPQQVFDPKTGEVRSAAERISGGDISGLGQFRDPATGELTDVMTPSGVAVDRVYGVETDPRRLDTVVPQEISGQPARQVETLPTQAATAVGVGGVALGEFGGASFLGGPAIQDYMNQAGTEAAVTQARQDYEVALNREQARQAQAGAFGARGTVEEAGLIEAQERNIAAIRGAGFERAAKMMEADAARRQQAGLQTQQLGAQTGLAGQALEAGRYESDAAREQQARQAAQQLTMQSGLQRQQLEQAALTRESELGVQTGLATQQLEAQRDLENAARAQQANLATQAQQMQAAMQTQQLGFQGGIQAQQLAQQANIRQAELDMEAARANQATALTSGSQTQQIESARQMRQAELNLQRQQQTQQLGLEAGMQQAGFGQQAAVRQAELDLQRQQATQGLSAEAFMQQQQLGQQAAMASASNALEAARADQQAALASGNQAAALEAQRRAQGAQAQIDIASQTQRLGAGAAGQQAQQEAVRRQRLAEMGLQAGGMGLDAQAQFRQQQMAGAQQLADLGGMTQGAAFGAAGQLAGMGAQQERAQQLQQAWDYEQFLRRQEGPAEALALSQAFMPGGAQQTWQRKPSLWGQIGGGLLSAGGLAVDAYTGSDVRMKENIRYAGMKNGFNLYDYNYLGSDNRYRGVMAQEVMKQRPDAVEDRNGVYWVNYDAIGIQLEAI